MRALALLVLLSLAALPTAYADGVRGLALPTRDRAEALNDIATEVAAALAERLDTVAVVAQVDTELARELATARALAASGELARAKTALDRALARALSRLHLLPADAEVLPALVEFAAILVAAGDRGRAGEVFDTILALDPGFTLPPEEGNPRMASALDSARRRAENHKLDAESVGSSCRDGVEVLVVARRGPSHTVELFRFDDCRLTASATTRSGRAADDLAAALDPGLQNSDAPFYKSGWFWAGTGAVVVAGSVAAFFLLREDRAEVRPIF